MNALRRFTQSVRSGFWAVPSVAVLLALAAAILLVRLDRVRGGTPTLAFGSGPSGAREVLSAISTSMITFTGLVFSITIVVLQLTSSQFSPRVLRTFLRDRQTQVSLAVFVATFVYAVAVLRSVDSSTDTGFVPARATTGGVVLLLLSVGVFVAYIHHVATAIQVSSIIAAVGREAGQTVDRRWPADLPEQPDPVPALSPATAVLPSRRAGVLAYRDEPALVRLACRADVVLVTDLPVGGFIASGAPLVTVIGPADRLDEDATVAALSIVRDRTMQQDVAFGLRQLVDIAERALSPGINDPTTAVQSLDQIHELLRRLVTRPARSRVHRDGEGDVRLVVHEPSIADLLDLSLQEICQYGRDSVPVQRRVHELLADLAAAARPEHRPAVRAWRSRLARDEPDG